MRRDLTNVTSGEKLPRYVGNAVAEMILAYPVPLMLAVVAWIPLDILRGVLFSGHGGLGWFLLLVSFPWLVIRTIVILVRVGVATPTWRLRRVLGVLAAYIPISVLCAYSLVRALNPPLTNTLWNVLPWFYFPASLLIPGW